MEWKTTISQKQQQKTMWQISSTAKLKYKDICKTSIRILLKNHLFLTLIFSTGLVDWKKIAEDCAILLRLYCKCCFITARLEDRRDMYTRVRSGNNFVVSVAINQIFIESSVTGEAALHNDARQFL